VGEVEVLELGRVLVVFPPRSRVFFTDGEGGGDSVAQPLALANVEAAQPRRKKAAG